MRTFARKYKMREILREESRGLAGIFWGRRGGVLLGYSEGGGKGFCWEILRDEGRGLAGRFWGRRGGVSLGDSEGEGEGFCWEILRDGREILPVTARQTVWKETGHKWDKQIFFLMVTCISLNRNRAKPFHSRKKTVSSSGQSNAVSNSCGKKFYYFQGDQSTIKLLCRFW